MKTVKASVLTLSASALGALLLATSVQATPVTEVWAAPHKNTSTSVAVSYAGLNLNSREGMKVLKQRVEAAASKVCGHKDIRRAGGLSQALLNEQCQEEAIEAAMNQVSKSRVASSQ